MFCPRCGAEYRPGFTTCAECLVPLVERPPRDDRETGSARRGAKGDDVPVAHGSGRLDQDTGRPRPDLELVTVFVTGDPAVVALAKSFLQSADIEFMTRGEGIQNLFGIGNLGVGGFNPITGPVEFLVAAEDADDARKLLEELTARDAGEDEEGSAPR